MKSTKPILSIKDLKVSFNSRGKNQVAVDGLSLALEKGQTLGIVGESGSGKTVTMLSILGLLLDTSCTIESGAALFQDDNPKVDLLTLNEKSIAKYRGSKIGMIFQQPMSAFNPVMTIAKQLKEAIKIHRPLPPQVDDDIKKLLSSVEIEEPERALSSYPHQLSGGQLQRCMIAMAIINKPKILIADEPTTALDAITQKKILKLLGDLKKELDMSMIIISHDLGVIKSMAKTVVVMKEGKAIESGSMEYIFNNAQEPYTQLLLESNPSSLEEILHRRSSISNPQSEIDAPIILKVHGLTKNFYQQSSIWSKATLAVTAVNDISFTLKEEEILGVVGTSGSGKSTLAKLLIGLESPSSGEFQYCIENFPSKLSTAQLLKRKEIQIIFQDPYASLDPRMKAGESLSLVFRYLRPDVEKNEIHKNAIEILERVGLSEEVFHKYPHELSGGQRQRVCIARALATQPKILICDECVSALDVSIQSQILKLLTNLRDDFNLTIIFISHDLAVVNQICDRMLIMQNGKMVEEGQPQDIFTRPKEDYTKQLIEAML